MTEEELKKAQDYFNSLKLEIREIDSESPLSELTIGMDFNFKGQYKDGIEEGVSKIIKFYKEVPHWNGVPSEPKKNGSNDLPIFARLENQKEILLGFLGFGNKFRIADSYRLKYNK